MSEIIMHLKRLEDFTPQKALAALKSYMLEEDKKYINLSEEQLNIIKNGQSDSNMIKYVLSLGEALYQIVCVDDFGKIYVKKFCLSASRRYVAEYKMQLKDFTRKFAFDYLSQCISDYNSIKARLNEWSLNRIENGIADSNMIKYVVSAGYGMYQVAAIQECDANFITVVVKYSQV